MLCRRHEGGSGARAGAEVTDGKLAGGGLGGEPAGRRHETPGQQRDVEPEAAGPAVHGFVGDGEQIHQQRGQPRFREDAGDVAIPRAVAATAAPVSEEHGTSTVIGAREVPVERPLP